MKNYHTKYRIGLKPEHNGRTRLMKIIGTTLEGKRDVVLSTRETSCKFLPFLQKKKLGFCIFKNGEPEKYVHYSVVKHRLKDTRKRASKLSKDCLANVDYQYNFLEYSAKEVLEEMRRIERGEVEVENLANHRIFFSEGLQTF